MHLGFADEILLARLRAAGGGADPAHAIIEIYKGARIFFQQVAVRERGELLGAVMRSIEAEGIRIPCGKESKPASGTDAPQTGSTGNLSLWLTLMLVSGIALAAADCLKLRAPWSALGAALIVLLAACLLPRGEGASADETPMRIITRMGTAEVTAMIDTGNRLREPFSDLPVLIVSGRCLTKIIDAVCMDEREILPPGFRVVRYRALGGGGHMRCFRPERICALRGREWLDVPDMWVAIYPGGIPGGVDALAPPAVCGGENARSQSGRR